MWGTAGWFSPIEQNRQWVKESGRHIVGDRMCDGQQGIDLAGDGPGNNKSHVFDLLYRKGFASGHKYKAFSEEKKGCDHGVMLF